MIEFCGGSFIYNCNGMTCQTTKVSTIYHVKRLPDHEKLFCFIMHFHDYVCALCISFLFSSMCIVYRHLECLRWPKFLSSGGSQGA